MTTPNVASHRTDKRIPFLDGLRAIAVLAVLVHHTYSDVLPNFALGNVGVVIFFALSGFLILGGHTTPSAANPLGFWRNRVFRIVPAYAAVILLTYLILPSPGSLSPIYLATYTVNWPMAEFGTWPPGALAPLWSIGVEMQFYLLAPLLFISFRRLTVSALVIVSVTMTIIWMINSDTTGNGGVYYSTFLYVPVFAAGGLAATLPSPQISSRLPPFAVIFSLLGLLVLVVAWRPFPPYEFSSFVAPFVLPIIAFLLLWGLKTSRGATSVALLSAALSSRVLRSIASLSYSLYLVHLTVLYALGSLLLLLGIEVTVMTRTVFFWPVLALIAWLLHKLVEVPFLSIGQTDFLQTQRMTRIVSISLFLLPIFVGVILVIATALRTGAH